jgi:hypothetical protein
MSANDTQIAGGHYKDKPIQPWDYIAANNLGYFEGNVVRYISRWRDKGGVDDLRKAKHYIEKLIELETQVKPEYKGERLILPTDDGPLWIQWTGGRCPVDKDAVVEVRMQNKQQSIGPAKYVEWENRPAPAFYKNVVAYRVVKDESKTIHGFIPWAGGAMPVDGEESVEVVFGSQRKYTDSAMEFRWGHDEHKAGNIIGYRVIK